MYRGTPAFYSSPSASPSSSSSGISNSRCRFKPRFCSLRARTKVPGFQKHPSGLVKPARSARISGSAFIGHGEREKTGERWTNRRTDGRRKGRKKERKRREETSFESRRRSSAQNLLSYLRFPLVASSHTAEARRSHAVAASPRRAGKKSRGKNTRLQSADRSQSAQ